MKLGNVHHLVEMHVFDATNLTDAARDLRCHLIVLRPVQTGDLNVNWGPQPDDPCG
ncbi:MAG TPA: hypothetical protein VG826_20675 [Pirellulales bacterium]|nr:hypothetical protein [Pirellulales bacterium]